MQELTSLEKQLQSWTPRRPSAKIARRLFPAAAPARAFFRRAETWSWLTPIAACALTIVLAVQESNRHLTHWPAAHDYAMMTTLTANVSTSNTQPTFVMSQLDENMELNFWPHLMGTQAVINIRGLMPTNH
jgi:hypothetical protein